MAVSLSGVEQTEKVLDGLKRAVNAENIDSRAWQVADICWVHHVQRRRRRTLTDDVFNTADPERVTRMDDYCFLGIKWVN